MSILSLQDVLFLFICGAVHFIYRYRRRKFIPLPPALPGWPVVGNAFQLPLTRVHVFYKELARKLGSNIIYVEAFGQPIIVINDTRIAIDLLEKRSALYSSRPHQMMLVEVIGATQFFGLLPYGDEWRNHRRLFRQHFSEKHLPREQEKVLEFVRKALLPNLYREPQHFREHVQGCVGGISLSMTYGLPVQRNHDSLVYLSEEAFSSALQAASPGKYLVNIVPILKYVPEWAPGASFKKVAREVRDKLTRVLEEPYQRTLIIMDNGTAPESFVSASLENYKHREDFEVHESRIKQVASQVFGAAFGTTTAAVLTFFLAMLKYPEVQRKAQQEIDSIIESDRLPDFSDQQQLPYLSAVLKEVLRWNPIVPMGVPHLTSTDDVYEGYYIPKGSAIMVNTYAILQDENFFENPKEFIPERFMKSNISEDVVDPTSIASFGFGRRICPGSHIALSALYIVAASVLALFDISPEVDSEGNPINVVPEFVDASLNSEPLPFRCKITPRQGKDVEDLLQEYMGIEVL